MISALQCAGMICLLLFSMALFAWGYISCDFFGDRFRDNPVPYIAMVIGIIGIGLFMKILWF